MAGLDTIRDRMTEFLRGQGMEAVTAWPETARTPLSGPVAAVSLRACEGGPAGFQDYLGERYDTDAGRWVELYGKRVKLTFGLDLYAGRRDGAAGLRQAFDRLADALRGGGPAGLRMLELTGGEVEYDQDMGLYRCPAQALCDAYLYAVAEEGGTFLDFEIRGEKL